MFVTNGQQPADFPPLTLYSKIEWTHHTWNPWVGCTKLAHPNGSACDFCDAATWAKRTGKPELWEGERRRTTAGYWSPLVRIRDHKWWSDDGSATGAAGSSSIGEHQSSTRWAHSRRRPMS